MTPLESRSYVLYLFAFAERRKIYDGTMLVRALSLLRYVKSVTITGEKDHFQKNCVEIAGCCLVLVMLVVLVVNGLLEKVSFCDYSTRQN